MTATSDTSDPNGTEGAGGRAEASLSGGAAPTSPAGDGQANPQQASGAPIVVNGQYTKDLSFEAPTAPQIFGEMQKQSPDIGVNVDVNGRHLQDNVYEVTLHIKADCKVGENTAFIAELAYAGMFTVNVPKEHLEPVLLVECPRLLFPFARNILADISRDGGFPPLMLGMVDFMSMYQNQQKQAAEQSGQQPEQKQ